MTEPITKNAAAGQTPSAPEIRCNCGETFKTTKELEEHAQRYHQK